MVGLCRGDQRRWRYLRSSINEKNYNTLRAILIQHILHTSVPTHIHRCFISASERKRARGKISNGGLSVFVLSEKSEEAGKKAD